MSKHYDIGTCEKIDKIKEFGKRFWNNPDDHRKKIHYLSYGMQVKNKETKRLWTINVRKCEKLNNFVKSYVYKWLLHKMPLKIAFYQKIDKCQKGLENWKN